MANILTEYQKTTFRRWRDFCLVWPDLDACKAHYPVATPRRLRRIAEQLGVDRYPEELPAARAAFMELLGLLPSCRNLMKALRSVGLKFYYFYRLYQYDEHLGPLFRETLATISTTKLCGHCGYIGPHEDFWKGQKDCKRCSRARKRPHRLDQRVAQEAQRVAHRAGLVCRLKRHHVAVKRREQGDRCWYSGVVLDEPVAIQDDSADGYDGTFAPEWTWLVNKKVARARGRLGHVEFVELCRQVALYVEKGNNV